MDGGEECCRWRRFLRGADVFDAIQGLISVAAADFPEELRRRRDGIAERLFTALLRPAPEAPETKGVGAADGSPSDVYADDAAAMPLVAAGLDDDPAAALTEEIEAQSEIVGEVLRIKDILADREEQSDGELFEALRRLQLMQLSIETLKATEIGKFVSELKKHHSEPIRKLAKSLVGSWKGLVNEWLKAMSEISDNKTPDSVNPSVVEDGEGLPSPPLDEGAFYATQTNAIQLSETFFDGIDDDGNLVINRAPSERNSVNHEPARNRRLSKLSPFDQDERALVKMIEAPLRQTKLPEKPCNPQTKPSRPPIVESSGPGRPMRAPQHRPRIEPRQTQDVSPTQRKPLAITDAGSDEASVRAKLELSKRKLQEGYQQAENAKKQRTIQVMDLQDIPKPKPQQQFRHPSSLKPKNNIRQRLNGRR